MSDLLSEPTKKKRLTASDIRIGMTVRWAEPEWAIMWEVGEATGGASGRYADAVMMSLWPSRGLELHGVEIKVSRSDWKREAADPSKAEAVARYCDRWWIHTPPGVVDDLSALPPAWGLREFDGKAWRTIREAGKTDAEPVGRPFLAALLRRADGLSKKLIRDGVEAARERENAELEKQRERYAEDVARGVENKTRGVEAMAAKIAKFEEAFGKDVMTTWSCDHAELGRIARAIEKLGLTKGHTASVAYMAEELRKSAAALEAAIAPVAPPTPEPRP